MPWKNYVNQNTLPNSEELAGRFLGYRLSRKLSAVSYARHKKDKYEHIGMKHINTRTLGEKSFMYDLIKEI